MNAQLATRTATRGSGSRRRALWAGGGLAAALVIAAGIGAWQGMGQRDATTSEPANLGVASIGAPPASIARPVGAATVYIVRPQEDAEFIRRSIAEANAIRFAHGQPPVTAEVLMTELDASLVVETLPQTPNTTFVDLRR